MTVDWLSRFNSLTNLKSAIYRGEMVSKSSRNPELISWSVLNACSNADPRRNRETFGTRDAALTFIN